MIRLSVFMLMLCCSMVGKIQAQENVVATNQWQLALSVGYGSIENPIANAKDLNLYILPAISYYSDKLFLENTTLGYNLYDDGSLFIDVVGKLNEDGVYFQFDDIGVLAALGVDFGRYSARFNLDDIDRNVSYMAGLAINYDFSWWQLSTRLYHDISSVHYGSEFEVSANKVFELAGWQVYSELMMSHKSRELLDYYYQIHRHESVVFIGTYQPQAAGTNINIKLALEYLLSEQWALSLLYRKTWLSDEISDNPIIKSGDIDMFFTGVTYAF